jgi:hypothetical protein
VRQDDRAADHLVGVAGVDAEPEVGLDGRVEPDVGRVLGELGGLLGAVDRVRSTSLDASRYFLPCAMSAFLSDGLAASPLSRGVRSALADDFDTHAPRRPLDDLGGRLEVVRVQVGHLDLGDLADLSFDTRPTVSRFASPEPFSTPAALRRRSAAGGVLRMNVNEAILEDRDLGRMIWPRLSWVFSL